jgi:hypothetical protein
MNLQNLKLMHPKIYLLFLITFLSTFSAVFAGPGDNVSQAIILFPGAPNPTPDKCLIRTYLPETDPNASLRILSKDSTVIKEIPLGTEVGISSTPINVSDWANGTYLYQLFYKGEARKTLPLVVKH